MSSIFDFILPYLLLYKYVALFIITFLASLAFPLPSAPSLMAASAFAGQGYFSIAWVIFIAASGNILGDITGYTLSRLFGKPILYKLKLGKFLEAPKLQAIEKYLNRHPLIVIIASRAQVQTTMIVNILSGLSRMRLRKFLPPVFIGEIFQVLVYAAIGYFFGSNWQAINNLISQFSIVIMLVIIALAVVFWRPISKKLGLTEK